MFIYALLFYCGELYWRTFCRQINQGAKIRGEVKPILAMPGFWERLLFRPLPYWCSFNVKSSGGGSSDGLTEEESEMQCDKRLLPNEARHPDSTSDFSSFNYSKKTFHLIFWANSILARRRIKIFLAFRLAVFCHWVRDQTKSNDAENSLSYKTEMIHVCFFGRLI